MFGRKFDKFANFHTHLLANLRFVFHIKRK